MQPKGLTNESTEAPAVLPTREECIDGFAEAIVDIWHALTPEKQTALLATAEAALSSRGTGPVKPSPIPTPWLTPAELAHYIRVSESTANRLIAAGKIPVSVVETSPSRFNGRPRIHRDDADAYMRSCRNEANPGQRPTR